MYKLNIAWLTEGILVIDIYKDIKKSNKNNLRVR